MPSNKNAFNRYLILDELLSDRYHNYSIEALTNILEVRLAKDGFQGVSRRCVEKDIVYLENEPIYAEIERYKSETGKRCVRYADPTFSIFNKKLSNEERNLLCEVLETIGQFDGLDNFEWLEDFKSKLGVNEHEKIIYFSNNPYLKNSNLLGMLFSYIANKVVVHLTYCPFGEDELKEIDLHPYFLKQYNNRWYVIGAADSDGKILTYALDRIIGIWKLDGETFEMPNGFDSEEYFANYYGIISDTGTDLYTVKLKLSKNKPITCDHCHFIKLRRKWRGLTNTASSHFNYALCLISSRRSFPWVRKWKFWSQYGFVRKLPEK